MIHVMNKNGRIETTLIPSLHVSVLSNKNSRIETVLILKLEIGTRTNDKNYQENGSYSTVFQILMFEQSLKD